MMTAPIASLYFFQFLATLVLIFAGGLVTGTGSGLAVPDWPLSFGTLFPPMTGGVFYEHSHRLIAGAVLLISLLSTGLVWGTKRHAPSVKRVAALSLGLVFLQALLGGLTVLLKLPAVISAAHAVIGPTFLALTGFLFVEIRRSEPKILPDAPAQTYVKAGGENISFKVGYWLLWVQYGLGALARHGAGPLIPYHGFLGILILFHYLAPAGKNERAAGRAGAPSIITLIRLLNGALALQVLLGVFSWMTVTAHPVPQMGNWHRVGITSAHQTLAALILTAALLLAYSTFAGSPARPNKNGGAR